MQEDAFAAAYYHNEEPLYSKLCCLFGMDDVKVESVTTEVIVLSDGTVKLPTDEPSCYELPGADEEVNSPVLLPPRTTRRKLFIEDEEVSDRESTSRRGIHFIDIAKDGQLRSRIQHDRVVPKPPPFKDDAGGPSVRLLTRVLVHRTHQHSSILGM